MLHVTVTAVLLRHTLHTLQGSVRVNQETGELKLSVTINAKAQGRDVTMEAVNDLKQLSGTSKMFICTNNPSIFDVLAALEPCSHRACFASNTRWSRPHSDGHVRGRGV